MGTGATRSASPWAFFALAYGLSWALWVVAAARGMDARDSLGGLLYYLGSGGPVVAGVALVCVTEDREGRRDYWRRAVDFGRIGAQWYAVVLLLAPALTGLAIGLDLLLGGELPGFQAGRQLLSRPVLILPYAFLILLFGPLAELGWRGCALDPLQARHTALVASLLLGTAWAAWHLPLFFIEGTYHHGLGLSVRSTRFWLFLLVMLPESVLMTWIYNHTRRSTLSAVLFHFMVNYTGWLLEPTERAELLLVVLLAVAATAVVLIYGPRTLTRAQPAAEQAEPSGTA